MQTHKSYQGVIESKKTIPCRFTLSLSYCHTPQSFAYPLILKLCVFVLFILYPLYANVYDSAPSLPEVVLPDEPSLQEMEQDQIDKIRREFRGNPAISDSIQYRQNAVQQEIERDSTLKIEPDYTQDLDALGATEQYEFIVQYFFKIIDEIPNGEDYKIAIPLRSLGLTSGKKPMRTCTIQTKEHSLMLTHYNRYTKAEMQASIRKQIQYLLYNLLQEYKTEVIECLILNQAHLDDMNTAHNLQSRTKTIAHVRSYVLVDFHGGILTLQVFNPPSMQ